MPVVRFINAASAQNYTRQLACSIGSLVVIGLPEYTDNFDSLVTLVLKGHIAANITKLPEVLSRRQTWRVR